MKNVRTVGRSMAAGAFAVLLLAFPVAAQGQPSVEKSDSLLSVARTLTQRYLIVDTHIDAPTRLYRGSADLSVRGNKGQFDFVRAREGGLDVPFMSIYIPSSLEGKAAAGVMADSLIDLVAGLASRYPENSRWSRRPRRSGPCRDQAGCFWRWAWRTARPSTGP